MTDLIERVARALCKSDGYNPDERLLLPYPTAEEKDEPR